MSLRAARQILNKTKDFFESLKFLLENINKSPLAVYQIKQWQQQWRLHSKIYVQIWKQGTMPTNVTCQDVIGRQKRWTIGELYIKLTKYLTRISLECLQIDVNPPMIKCWLFRFTNYKDFSHRHRLHFLLICEYHLACLTFRHLIS